MVKEAVSFCLGRLLDDDGLVSQIKSIRLRRSMQVRHRGCKATPEQVASQWLLAEQPEYMKPDFLVLSDCRVTYNDEVRHSRDELLKLAHAWGAAMAVHLQMCFLQTCLVQFERLLPCEARVAGRYCDGNCGRYHAKQLLPGYKVVGYAVRELLEAVTRTEKLLEGSDLEMAMQCLGTKVADMFGGSTEWNLATELPKKAIAFLGTRLRVGVPPSILIAVESNLRKEEVEVLAADLLRRRWLRIEALKRPPLFGEAADILRLSQCCSFQRLTDLLDRTKDLPGNNPVSALVRSHYRLAKPTELKQQSPLDWLPYACDIVSRLQRMWQVARERNLLTEIDPASVCYLLEQLAVWSGICNKKLHGVLLPQSYITTHLRGVAGFFQALLQQLSDDADAEKVKRLCSRAFALILRFVRDLSILVKL